MQDLSHLLPGDPVTALVPTSSAGGNQTVSNEQAMTAPGSAPSTPFTSVPGEVIEHGPPAVEALSHDRSVVTHGTDPKPMLRLGEWNNL